jgi:light-regulated signal transduction histidine kinase (bacteriophytochrome)
MRYITDGTTRLQRLVRDLLTYVPMGQAIGTLRPTDMTHVLSDLVAELDIPIREKRLVMPHHPLPHVLTQSDLRTPLWHQLLTQALTVHDSQSLCTHIAVEPRKQTWQVAIRDHGMGVEPKYAKPIFFHFLALAFSGGRLWHGNRLGCLSEDCRAALWTDLGGVGI